MKRTFFILLALVLVVCSLSCRNVVKSAKKPGNAVQGAVAKENIKIGNKTFAKTREIVVIPAGTTATIIGSVENWNTYYDVDYDYFIGVFIDGRTVTLSPYVMSAYEVTQELYQAIMNENPSSFKTDVAAGETQGLRPVETVSWYETLVFCNKLSEKCGLTPCYSINNETDTSLWGAVPTTQDATWDAVVCDFSANGYRLPTEAEWEFAARGGNPTKPEWKYAYAGVQTNKEPANFTSDPYDDDVLDEYAWYSFNSDTKTHEVGKKTANTLGLYDMSGNAWEWCYDWYDDNATKNDSAYTVDDAVVNPLGATSGDYRLLRGGDYNSDAHVCTVSYRESFDPNDCDENVVFRLVRSIR